MTATATKMLMSWLIADSGGKGHVMVVNFPSVAASAVLTADIKKYAQEHCSECTVDSVDVQLSQLANGQSVQTTVSAVQANP